MGKIKNRIKSVLRSFWEYKYSLAVSILIVAIVLSGIHYFENGQSARANISFNYSEASNGLNPNNTRFNFYEMFSEEVLSGAIELAGLQDSITAKELSDCISISPVDTGNANGDDNYISTTYSVFLDISNVDVKNRSVRSLLENICNAYKTYFLKNNGDNQEILKLRLDVTESGEPYLRLNEIKLRANQIERYLSSRMKQNRAFSDSVTGMSFDELDKRLKNIISYDIPNTSAFIIECGVAENSDTLTEILEYKNKMESISADKQMEYYEADNNGIAMYEKLMSSIVMIPTMDEQEQYYMSRTKTAMDKMARNADSELAEATSHKKEIVSTNYVIEKMRNVKSDANGLAYAREMINRLENGINDLSNDLFELDKSYIEYMAQNYITFNYYEASFIQKIAVKKTAAEIIVLLMILAAVFYVNAAGKEQKENEKI